MENTKAHPSVTGCENRSNSKYYLVVVQVSMPLAICFLEGRILSHQLHPYCMIVLSHVWQTHFQHSGSLANLFSCLVSISEP